MRWVSTKESYGLVSIALHWSMAVLVIGMFALGEYMTGLDYMDPWYTLAPHLHKSFGLVVFALLVFRFAWALGTPKPELVEMPRWEKSVAVFVHWLFYPLLFAVLAAGYMIPTAKGRGVMFFNLFEVPALVSGLSHQEDVAGVIHRWLVFFTIALVILHTLASLKHHFINRDSTLLRMLGIEKKD